MRCAGRAASWFKIEGEGEGDGGGDGGWLLDCIAAFAALLHCCTAALLHCCTAALLHCCRTAGSPHCPLPLTAAVFAILPCLALPCPAVRSLVPVWMLRKCGDVQKRFKCAPTMHARADWLEMRHAVRRRETPPLRPSRTCTSPRSSQPAQLQAPLVAIATRHQPTTHPCLPLPAGLAACPCRCGPASRCATSAR
jgi:hypothetical protein